MSLEEIFPLPPKYIFQSELPKGFLGSSALVKNADTGQLCVCKSFLLDQIGPSDRCQRFKERIDHIQAVQSKYVVSYNDLIETKDRLLLIRPYIPESPITESLCQGPDKENLGAPNSVYSFWQTICQCFGMLHAHHIFPNFIKPNNVFITKERKILITDLYPPPNDIDVMLHTPIPFNVGFLAPEFFNQKPTGRYSDFWSLGVLLAFMVTKSLPWSSKNLFTMLQQINTCSLTFSTQVPEKIESVIRSMVALDPSQRKLPILSSRQTVTICHDRNSVDLSESQALLKKNSARNQSNGFLMLQDKSKGIDNNISRATTTKLLQNGLKQNGNILLRSRTISKNLYSSPNQPRQLNPSQNTIKSPSPALKGSAIKLPSFKNFD